MSSRAQIGLDNIGHLSGKLLDHDKLMTPVLQSEFGETAAREVCHSFEDCMLLRQSSLFQRSTGLKVLDAKLEIFIDVVPKSIIEQLATTEKLFGHPLIENVVLAETYGRRIFARAFNEGTVIRWGRRLLLRRCTDHTVLCRVEELLVSEAELHHLHRKDGPILE